MPHKKSDKELLVLRLRRIMNNKNNSDALILKACSLTAEIIGSRKPRKSKTEEYVENEISDEKAKSLLESLATEQ